MRILLALAMLLLVVVSTPVATRAQTAGAIATALSQGSGTEISRAIRDLVVANPALAAQVIALMASYSTAVQDAAIAGLAQAYIALQGTNPAGAALVLAAANSAGPLLAAAFSTAVLTASQFAATGTQSQQPPPESQQTQPPVSPN